MDYSLIFASLSLIVSLVNALYSYSQKEKLNKINIRSKYFEKIFDEHLIIKLPEARKYVRFDKNGSLKDTNALSEALTDMRKDALYFMYADRKFYDKLRTLIENLDDYINECGNKNYHDHDQQSLVFNTIQDKMESIYNCVINSSIGKK